MATPTAPPKLLFDGDKQAGYTVVLDDGTVIGFVRCSPLHPRLWNAYPDSACVETLIVAQRTTREHAGQALVLRHERRTPAVEQRAVGAAFPTGDAPSGLRLVWNADRNGGT